MILLDASALVAWLAGEPASGQVARILREGDAAVVSVNLAEVLDILVRVMGHDPEVVDDKLVPVLESWLPVVAVGEAEARAAAEIRARRYHRESASLSLADCVLLGVAALRSCGIGTSDALMAQTARAEGTDIVALPNSSGERP